MLTLSAVLIGSYLLGSIPFGYLAGRLVGIDIREAAVVMLALLTWCVS